MPADDLIVSVSGIRGIVGKGLTPRVVGDFASALGTFARGGKIVLSRDGRPSGQMLHHAVCASLIGQGCQVQDIGVAPTPTVGIMVRQLEADGAIQITASHNPAPWNGMKLFGADGRILSARKGAQIKLLYESGQFAYASWSDLGRVDESADAAAWHRDRVLGLVDVAAIRARKFKVLLDANGGAGGPLGTMLLDALECQTIAVGCEADGDFRHEPEPTEDNLQSVCPEVAKAGADIGFVLDPDADRLAIIDENGRYIGEEMTLALAVWFRLQQQLGPVVVNMSTSRMVEDLCAKFGVACHRSAVGEANVTDVMQQVDAVIGGEGNGGVIDPRAGFVRDPFIGICLILNLLAEKKVSMSQCLNEIVQYAIVKNKHQIDRERLPDLFAALAVKWPEAKPNRLDGLRLDWPDRWIHVRPSNTEPIVRIIAEAPSQADAEKLCEEAMNSLTTPAGAPGR